MYFFGWINKPVEDTNLGCHIGHYYNVLCPMPCCHHLLVGHMVKVCENFAAE